MLNLCATGLVTYNRFRPLSYSMKFPPAPTDTLLNASDDVSMDDTVPLPCFSTYSLALSGGATAQTGDVPGERMAFTVLSIVLMLVKEKLPLFTTESICVSGGSAN